MRLALASAAWITLVLAPTSGRTVEELAVRYEVGQRLVVESEERYADETTDVSVSVNGEDLPEEAVEEMGMRPPDEESVERVRTVTEFTSVEEGRPATGRRTFEVVERTETKGDEDEDLESPLEGLTLLLTQVDEDEVEAEVDDEDAAVDDVYLENHRLKYPVEEYLPDGPVDVGDSWDVEGERLHALFQLDGPTYFEPDDSDEAFEEAIRDNFDGSATVTFERVEERGGVECAVLVVEVEIQVAVDDLPPEFFGQEEGDGELEGVLTMNVEGTDTVWLALEGGRPVANELEVEGTLEVELNVSNADLGFDMVITIAAEMTGSETSTWTLE